MHSVLTVTQAYRLPQGNSIFELGCRLQIGSHGRSMMPFAEQWSEVSTSSDFRSVPEDSFHRDAHRSYEQPATVSACAAEARVMQEAVRRVKT